MNRVLTIGITAAAAAMLQTAMMAPANAEYMGYGNGDPGNWDFATEQSGGPCGKGTARAIDPATGQPKCCAQYNPQSACPLLRTGLRFDRPTRRLAHNN
ncbi:MAG: hypothetical protein ABI457_02285 [Hyphomicrobium sp.]|jgi:hypothetical protein